MLFRLHRKPKQHLLGPRLLTLLVIACAGYIAHTASTAKHIVPSFSCERGPLLSLSVCYRNNAEASATFPEWRYSYAGGPLDPAICAHVSLNEEKLTIPFTTKAGDVTLLKTDCNALQLDSTHICYASQILSGGKRILTTLTMDSHCDDARFFHADNTSLVNSTPVPQQQWQTPYAMIPELK